MCNVFKVIYKDVRCAVLYNGAAGLTVQISDKDLQLLLNNAFIGVNCEVCDDYVNFTTDNCAFVVYSHGEYYDTVKTIAALKDRTVKGDNVIVRPLGVQLSEQMLTFIIL
jgi:hypothetical protein